MKTSVELSLVNDYMSHQSVDTSTSYPYEAWLRGLGRDQDHFYRELMKQIVNWANLYMDDIIEIIVCLIIFFRQNQVEWVEFKNIAQIEAMWR